MLCNTKHSNKFCQYILSRLVPHLLFRLTLTCHVKYWRLSTINPFENMPILDYSIFGLCHSLTKKEAIKVSAFLKDMGTHHSILQLELFERLRFSRSNDEEKLKPRLQSDELLKYLSYHKDRLKEHILTVLWSQEKGMIRQAQEISQSIDKCIILRQRGFGNKAIQELDKIANKIDFNLFPELKIKAQNELQVLLRNAQGRLESDELITQTEKTQNLLKGLETSTHLKLLSDRAYSIYARHRKSSNPALQTELKEILDDPLLSSVPINAGFMAVHRYYSVLFFVNNVKGDSTKALELLEANRSEWLKQPSMMEAHPHVYAGVVINLLNIYLGEAQFGKFELLHGETANLSSSDRIHQAEIQSRLTDIWLLYLLNRKMTNKAHELDDKLVKQLVEYEKVVSPNTLLSLMYNFAILWFVSDELQKATDWLNHIVSLRFKTRLDIVGIAQILLTLLTLDRNNPDYTQSAHRKIKRFYKMSLIQNGLSVSVLHFLNQFMKSNSLKDERLAIETLSEELKSLNSSGLEVIGKDEILLWTESYLTGKSVKTVWHKT